MIAAPSASPSPRRPASSGEAERAQERRLRAALAALALPNIALGLWSAVAPHTFFDAIANYGPYARHGISDFAAVSLALGAGLLLAVGVPQLRPGVVLIAGLFFALHAVVHVVDLGAGQAAVPAVVTLAALTATAAALLALLRTGARAAA